MLSKVSELILSAFSMAKDEVNFESISAKDESILFRRSHQSCRWQLTQSVDPQSSQPFFHWTKRKPHAS